MTDTFLPALRPDLFGQLAATDPYQRRARRLFERGQVVAVGGNQADVRVGYDARGNALDLQQVPIISGYVPGVGDWVAVQYEAGHSGAPWVTGPSMAADELSDAAGIGVFPVRESEPADPQRSAIYFDESLETWRGWDGAEWVDFSGKLHNSLPDLQGGTAGEYYHLTAAEHAAIGGGSLPASAVIYADADGKLAGDPTKVKWTGSQLQLLSGSAAAPAISAISYSDDGIFWPADNALGFATQGAERARINNAGLQLAGSASAAGHHLIFAGDRAVHFWLDQIPAGTGMSLDLYQSVHSSGKAFHWGRSQGIYDRASFLEYMRLYVNDDATTQLLLAAGAAGTPSYAFLGDPNSGLYSAGGDILGFAAGGAAQWLLGTNALYPAADNAETLGASGAGIAAAYFSAANAAAPSVNGEVRAFGSHLQQFAGGQASRISSLLYSLAADDQRFTTNGTLAEQNLVSATINSAYLVAGNTFAVVAAGVARLRPNSSPPSQATVIKLRIESTDIVATPTITTGAGGSSSDWVGFLLRAHVTVRDSANLEVTVAELRYDVITQGANPWPVTSQSPSVRVGVSDVNVAASGNVTVAVRASIANGNSGDLSYITVRKLNRAGGGLAKGGCGGRD